MRRRELLTGSAAAALSAGAAQAFGVGKLGAGLGRLGSLGKAGGSGPPPFVPLSGSAFDLSISTNQFSIGSLSNFSVTRAQTGLRFVDNLDGTVTPFAANTLRIAPGKGLLIEQPYTNLLLQSADLSNAAWSNSLTGSGTLSITGAAGVAPDGTNTASLVTVNRSAVTDQAQRFQSFSGTAVAYGGGFYVKANSNADIGKTITVGLWNGTTTNFPATIVLTGGWQRAPNSATLAASGTCNVSIGYSANDNAGTGQVNFQVWGGQANIGAGLLSYVPTTTAPVAVAGDVITANGIALTTLQSTAATIFARVWGAQSNVAGDRIIGFNASPRADPDVQSVGDNGGSLQRIVCYVSGRSGE
jgi:hypothetical protein